MQLFKNKGSEGFYWSKEPDFPVASINLDNIVVVEMEDRKNGVLHTYSNGVQLYQSASSITLVTKGVEILECLLRAEEAQQHL